MTERKFYRHAGRRRAMAAAGAVVIAGGGSAIGVAAVSQYHRVSPTPAQAGTLEPPGTPPAGATGVAHSQPVSIDIPAIDVHSKLASVGVNPDGTIEAPPLFQTPSEAAWYRYSPTPGQPGPSIIEGHVDNGHGPAIFYHLAALQPGQEINVTLTDSTVVTFTIDGVRQYPKARFPTRTIYGNTDVAALRLLTCGGSFDSTTHHYLDNTVVFASLVSSHPLRPR